MRKNVFLRGGTSLSKCYPGSIERFSEDIDLTYLGMEEKNNICDKTIKKIESIITESCNVKKIPEERSQRSKSMYVWFDDENEKIKIEIGSSVKPDPYSKKSLKSYIHEYLEAKGFVDDIVRFELKEVIINTLNIERTFIDKVMAIKRHAITQNLNKKVRHIYDVVMMFKMEEIQEFIINQKLLKDIVVKTKNTDSYYLEKRSRGKEYNANSPYDFKSWKDLLNNEISIVYEHLHETLLYTNKKQSFAEAIETLERIDEIFKKINE